MEQHEIDLITKYQDQDPQLKELWDEHLALEQELERFINKPFLTPQEQNQVKELKKRKLIGKSKIQNLLEGYSKKGA
jgi:hypothetical protein